MLRAIILAIFVFVFFDVAIAVEQETLPKPDLIIKEWKQIDETTWSPGLGTPFHVHDYYYIDPTGESNVEIAGYTSTCPNMGGKPIFFVYRTRDQKLTLLQYSYERGSWMPVSPKSEESWAPVWNKDFDRVLKRLGQQIDDEKFNCESCI